MKKINVRNFADANGILPKKENNSNSRDNGRRDSGRRRKPNPKYDPKRVSNTLGDFVPKETADELKKKAEINLAWSMLANDRNAAKRKAERRAEKSNAFVKVIGTDTFAVVDLKSAVKSVRRAADELADAKAKRAKMAAVGADLSVIDGRIAEIKARLHAAELKVAELKKKAEAAGGYEGVKINGISYNE